MKNNREENLVLVIDDDEMNLQIARMILEKKLPCKVLTATSAKQGISILRSQKVCVLLLDILMPDVDGIKTLKMIRAEEKLKNIPVIILTATMERETIMQVAALGVKDYIRKPFMPAELVERVSKKLEETAASVGKILLVDENRYSLKKMMDIIEEVSPHEVWPAVSAADAVDVLRDMKINLVIASASIKFIDGFRLMDFMARDEKCSKIPCVITTAEEILDVLSKINLSASDASFELDGLGNSAVVRAGTSV